MLTPPYALSADKKKNNEKINKSDKNDEIVIWHEVNNWNKYNEVFSFSPSIEI